MKTVNVIFIRQQHYRCSWDIFYQTGNTSTFSVFVPLRSQKFFRFSFIDS